MAKLIDFDLLKSYDGKLKSKVEEDLKDYALPKNTLIVNSVNNKSGSVTLDSADVGADAEGTASQLVSSHNNSNAAHSDLFNNVNNQLNLKQFSEDSDLQTDNKFVVGAINEVNSIAKEATNAKSFDDYQDLITNINNANSTQYRIGQSFFVQTLGVPDLWIMSIENTHQVYTYTDDSDFIEDTLVAGGCQVGYYKLAQLETQKVDLSGYVPTTRTIAGLDLEQNISKTSLLSNLNVEEGAQVNIQADWGEEDSSEDSYIKNKPDLNSKLDKQIISGGSYSYVYVTKNDGTQGLTAYSTSAANNSIALRNYKGEINVNIDFRSGDFPDPSNRKQNAVNLEYLEKYYYDKDDITFTIKDKVDEVQTSNIIYGTDDSGEQTTYSVSYFLNKTALSTDIDYAFFQSLYSGGNT